jgi:hypothetical protein
MIQKIYYIEEQILEMFQKKMKEEDESSTPEPHLCDYCGKTKLLQNGGRRLP